VHYQHLELERLGRIATLSLKRPEVGNALSVALMQEIIDAAASFKQDTECRVIIIRGEGKHFSVGADLKDPARHMESGEADLMKRSRATSLGRDLIESLLGIDQITIAAVQGAAAGGGACIASACDFRIGSDDCQIGYPEVKLGMNLSWGALPLCYNLVGPGRAKRMVIGGELESATNLERWGFLDELCPRERLLEAARTMAEYYADRPPLAAQMIKRSLNALQLSAMREVMHMDGDQFVLATLSLDYQNAIAAFLERKKSK